ncbi:RDD family protein, partial [Streptomyces apricus]|uniref:RDD family protein n=1 Tax=Streptomyces apricus TaxID=1828112 RepID=UPI002E276E4B
AGPVPVPVAGLTAPGPVPVRAAVGRRVVAWAVDFALVLVAAYLLALLTFHRIAELLTDVPGLSALGGWELLGADGDARHRAGQLALSLWQQVVLLVVEAFVLLVMGTFVYHWAALALTGRTLGKKLLGLGVAPRTGRAAALRAAVTTVTDVGCFALACCLLVAGALVMAVAVWALAVALFWANALAALSPRGRTLADRIAGTCVVRVPPPGGEHPARRPHH